MCYGHDHLCHWIDFFCFDGYIENREYRNMAPDWLDLPVRTDHILGIIPIKKK
jgi:hypothetical protein